MIKYWGTTLLLERLGGEGGGARQEGRDSNRSLGNYEEDWGELYHNALCIPLHYLCLPITEGALKITNDYWPCDNVL